MYVSLSEADLGHMNSPIRSKTSASFASVISPKKEIEILKRELMKNKFKFNI